MSDVDAIYIPRGTCRTIAVEVESNGIDITSQGTLTLTVRELPSPESPILIQVQNDPGTNFITLHEDDTKIPVGKYSADIRFTIHGCTISVWGTDEDDTSVKNLKNFIILAGVGDDE